MPSTTLFPLIALGLFLAFTLTYLRQPRAPMRNAWLLPAALSLLFLGISLYTVVTEGLLGFWTEHTRNLWGNQIWYDLLLAIGAGWYFLVSAARSLGMRPLPWLAFILCTGSIGLLAMVARVVYLREHAGVMAAVPTDG